MPLNQNQVRVNSDVLFSNAKFGKGAVFTLATEDAAKSYVRRTSSKLAFEINLLRHHVYGHFRDGVLRWVSRAKICEKYLCQLPSYAMK